jgi:hypothetical protein
LPVRAAMPLSRSIVVLGAAAVLLGSGELGDARAADDAPSTSGAPTGARDDSPADAIDSPSVVGVAPVVAQRDAGFDLVASVRQRAGASLVGSELDARVSIGRREGALTLAADGMLRRAIGTRDDVDAQASATALVAIARALRIGAEARARGEVVEGIVAADDAGRPVEVLAGVAAGVTAGSVTLRTLAGFCWPRGPMPAGPAALAGASFVF